MEKSSQMIKEYCLPLVVIERDVFFVVTEYILKKNQTVSSISNKLTLSSGIIVCALGIGGAGDA